MAAEDNRFASLPPLIRDVAFWGMTGTQFLGAFNDNLFKQLILLWCVDFSSSGATDQYQPIAMIVFSTPFILFSGYAGYLADRYSKRQIVVLCKVAEILVMLLGMLAFWAKSFIGVFVILFCMGTHSAFFGPSKYGVLPELIRERDIPKANGIFLLTTFLAIIFGFSSAGLLKQWLGTELWVINGACVIIAILGTMTALTVRPTPPSMPELNFSFSITGVAPETWKLLFGDWRLMKALLLSSMFWFLGGVVQQVVNALAKLQFHLDDTRTSIMQGVLALGIGFGCALAGVLSRGHVDFRLARIGGWGIVVTAILLWVPSFGSAALVSPADNLVAEQTKDIAPSVQARDQIRTLLGPVGSYPAFALFGLCAGLFAVPLQAFIQIHPPADQKGRVLGAMNWMNFFGILLSGAFYWCCDQIFFLLHLPRSTFFAAIGGLMLLTLVLMPPDKNPE